MWKPPSFPSAPRSPCKRASRPSITQSLGGSYTVIVNGNMFRIEGKDADALGLEPAANPPAPARPITARTAREGNLEPAQELLRPGNPGEHRGPRPDLRLPPHRTGPGSYKADVKMTLTAPGCGMGPVLAQDVQNKLLCLEGIDDVAVELVWDPPWHQSMMTEAAKLQLGLL